jgi:phosphoadenosine phosphosulfate reductase
MDLGFISSEEISAANREYEGQSPEVILRWATKRFGYRLIMATAFGAEGCCLIHMLSKIDPTTRVINLETGYQFSETLELRERILHNYGIAVEFIRPKTSVEEYERMHGGPLYEDRPDQCCYDRKIVPLRAAVAGSQAWISSIRRDQTEDRSKADTIEWDSKFELVKINPILQWTIKDVWNFINKNGVPYNPLHDAGYPSIGCRPCTRRAEPDGDERSGRWAGTKKKECGLHVFEHQQGSGI